MVAIAPVIVVGLAFMLIARRQQPYPTAVDPWSAIAPNVFFLWSFLMLPLFIALEAALTGHIEFNGNNWKHLFALPIPRWTIYSGKVLVNLFLILLASLFLLFWLGLFGFLILFVRSDLNLVATVPPMKLFLVPLVIFVCSLLIIALHSWISMRWQSVVIGLGVGIAAVVASLLLINSDLWHIYPWSIPAVIAGMMMGNIRPDNPAVALANAWNSGIAMVISGIIIAVIGGVDICRRETL